MSNTSSSSAFIYTWSLEDTKLDGECTASSSDWLREGAEINYMVQCGTESNKRSYMIIYHIKRNSFSCQVFSDFRSREPLKIWWEIQWRNSLWRHRFKRFRPNETSRKWTILVGEVDGTERRDKSQLEVHSVIMYHLFSGLFPPGQYKYNGTCPLNRGWEALVT